MAAERDLFSTHLMADLLRQRNREIDCVRETKNTFYHVPVPVQAAELVLRVVGQGKLRLADHLIVETAVYFRLTNRPDQLREFYALVKDGVEKWELEKKNRES